MDIIAIGWIVIVGVLIAVCLLLMWGYEFLTIVYKEDDNDRTEKFDE